MKVIARGPYKVTLKSRSGKSRVRWQIKLWTEDHTTGQRKKIAQKTFESKAIAREESVKLIALYERTHGQITVGEKMTFADLAGHAKTTFYKPAVIIAGRKIDGVKQHKIIHGQIDTLSKYFGDRRIGTITDNDLREYKRWRFDLGSLRGKTRGLAITMTAINRELAIMRRMMKHAFTHGWVTRDIFAGSKVIDIGAETVRNRIINDLEEAALLEHCDDRGNRGNKYLRSIILLALDSAMRKSEIMKLRWKDLNFELGEITIIGEHTKTQTTRIAPLSSRAIAELQKLPTIGRQEKVFPIADFKRSWETTRRLAGLDDIRFHDLRRTAITRWQHRGVALAVAGKIAGHARLETTAKIYTAPDAAMVQQVRALIDLHNDKSIQETSEFVN